MFRTFKNWLQKIILGPIEFDPQTVQLGNKKVLIVRADWNFVLEFEQIQKELYGNAPWSHENFVSELANKRDRLYLAAVVDHYVVGFIGCSLNGKQHITNLAVRKKYQQQGIGKLLLKMVIEYCRADGAKEITLEVDEQNYPARLLYENLNFQPIEVKPNYYLQTHHDAITMCLDLKSKE